MTRKYVPPALPFLQPSASSFAFSASLSIENLLPQRKMRRNDDVQWHGALTNASTRFLKFVRDVLSLPASGLRSGRLTTRRIRTRTPPWRNPAIVAPKVRGISMGALIPSSISPWLPIPRWWKVVEDLGGERAQELIAARLERKRQAPLPSARLGSWPDLRTLVKFPKRKWSTETWPEPRGAISHRDWVFKSRL